MREPIRFYHRGAIQEIDGVEPTLTVLQYLREVRHCTGTKEGCAEGDCGACTVVVGELGGDGVALHAVNACIQFLPTLDGKALFTVEDLAAPDGALHPVQQAMLECHGSQCGFCTPGFVMSLWGMYLERKDGDPAPARRAIDHALSGNLCRCTGYRPIVDAARRMGELPAVRFDRAALAETLGGLRRTMAFHYQCGNASFHAPRTVAELSALRAENPDAVLLAGSTDVGLWVTKQLRELNSIIHVSEVASLRRIEQQGGMLEIGAAVTLEDAYRALCQHYPAELGDMWRRFASLPVRNAGTLGGNVANGSPIGDSMPWMLALGSEVVLHGVAGRRILPLENFYLGYQKKDLRPDEFVEMLRIPLPRADWLFRTYKLARRYDQDISAVCAAFAIRLEHGRVAEARIAFGGMAAIPQRASRAEAVLQSLPWEEQAIGAAAEALAEDYAPLSDMRASAAYRIKAAQNLLLRFWLETRIDKPLAAAEVDAFGNLAAR